MPLTQQIIARLSEYAEADAFNSTAELIVAAIEG